MNLILLQEGELDETKADAPSAHSNDASGGAGSDAGGPSGASPGAEDGPSAPLKLPAGRRGCARFGCSDRRFRHITKVLGAKAGDTLRVGLEGGLLGEATVVSIVVATRATGSGPASGAGGGVSEGSDARGAAAGADAAPAAPASTPAAAPLAGVLLECFFNTPPPPPVPVTLVVALPRPKVFASVLMSATTMGIKEVYVIGTARGEAKFWSSHVVRRDDVRAALVEACEQARDTVLPRVHMRRDFARFAADELPSLAAAEGTRAIVAHPPTASPPPAPPVAAAGAPAAAGAIAGAGSDDSEARAGAAAAASAAAASDAASRRVVVAMGPEAGFVDEEVRAFEAAGFSRTALPVGPRILKVEHACTALLALAAAAVEAPRTA